MRIYELAKQLNVPSKEVVAECKRRRIEVKNHMSSLNDAEIRRVVEAFQAREEKKKIQDKARKKAEEKKRRETEVVDALAQKRRDIQQMQKDESRMLEEARLRRLEEQRAQEERERKQQKLIEAEQRDRALEVAERAKLEREKASKAATQANQEEMALLQKARELRAQKEKHAREEAARREAEGQRAPEPEVQEPTEARRLGGREAGRKDLKGIRQHGRDKLRPTQLYAVGDIVRREGAPAGPDRAEAERRGRTGPTTGGRGRERDRQRAQNRDLRERRREEQSPLDGRIRSRRRQQPAKPSVTQIEIKGAITTRELADLLGISTAEVIRSAFQLGEGITINQQLSDELVQLLAENLGVEVEIHPDTDEADIDAILVEPDPEGTLKPRPPVVTVMGHVDHGKTSLLDKIRKTAVAEGEAGGITQHIGAYQVPTARGTVTFLDTPGHAAFTSMRARGAKATDVVILVVAATEGVQPQTVEAINHARAAEVPIIVAMNKMDLPGADPSRVKSELMRYELLSEDMGGETMFVPISAKTGDGIDDLLENVALQTEILELKANPDRSAIGTVVESHIDAHRGAVATILVQRGTLKHGDYFVVGHQSGRVRAMYDHLGREIDEAPPSTPVEVLGLTGSPEAGEQFLVLPNEREARQIAERRQERRRSRDLVQRQSHVTLDTFHARLEEGEIKELNLIVKADVQGSLEAIVGALSKLESEKIRIRMIHTGVGGVNESDVQLADVSDAIVIGFNVRSESSALNEAEIRGVQVKTYQVIYDLLDDIKAAMEGMLEPIFEEETTGQVEVLEVFRTSKGTVAGCIVREGEVHRSSKVRLYRDNAKVYEGEIASLRRIKEDVSTVKKGLECGILIRGYNDVKVGDVIEPYRVKEVAATL